MKKILFVCTGNTCRSPMAAYLFWKQIQEKGLTDAFCVDSAGLMAYDGDSISENARLVLKEHGIDASAHRAKQLTRDLAEEADRIFVMTQAHKDMISAAMPETADKISVLSVPDPYGMELEAYRSCLTKLEAAFSEEQLFT